MFGQHGTGLSLIRNVMNHLPLIRKKLCKKDLLHQAELLLASKPSQAKPAELNIRLIEKAKRRRKLHQAELLLASRSVGCSSAQLNSRLALKAIQSKRLHNAQIVSITK